MTFQIYEWGELGLGGELTRAHADRLLAAARGAGFGENEVLVDHGRTLRARQVVGVLAAGELQLEILPKIDSSGGDAGPARVRERLIHMLAVAYDLHLEVAGVAMLGTQRETVLEALIGAWARTVATALRGGLPQRYLAKADDLTTLRGRLDVQRQCTRLLAAPGRLACRYDERAADIPLNQVVKAAITRLLPLARAHANRQLLLSLADVYSDVGTVAPRGIRWDVIKLDRTTRRWETPLALARLLLDGEHQTTASGTRDGFALLFSMDKLFERYVARLLASACRPLGLEVLAQDRSRWCLEEVDEPRERRFQLRPDLLVRRDGRTVLVIDTKWKRLHPRLDDRKHGVGDGDIYQIMAYGRFHACPRLMLLYPHHGKLAAAGPQCSYRVADCAHILSVATLDLTSPLSDVRRQLEALMAASCFAPASIAA